MKYLILAIMSLTLSLNLYADINRDLIKAVKNNDLDLVKRLVAQGADPRTGERHWGYDIDAPLIWAAQEGNLEIVKFLESHGASPYSHDGLVLEKAARERQNLIMEYMLQKYTFSKEIIHEALNGAATGGDLKIIQTLLDHGADASRGDWSTRSNAPIKWAAYRGNLEAIKLLANNGGDIHAEKEQALLGAALNGHLELVKYLVDHGANINISNGAPLRFAVDGGHLDVVQYLLSQKPKEIYIQTKEFLRGAFFGGVDLVKLLLEYGYQPNISQIQEWLSEPKYNLTEETKEFLQNYVESGGECNCALPGNNLIESHSQNINSILAVATS